VQVTIIVSNVYPPRHGGIEKLMSRLAELRARCGTCVVVAPRVPGSDAYDADAPYRVIRYRDARKPANVVAIAFAFVQALALVRDRTTIASNWWPAGAPLALVPRFWRGPLAVFAHGSDVAPEKSGLRRAAMRFVFERADVVLANSSFTRGLLAEAGVRGKVAIVSLGVDLQAIEPQRSSEPTLLSVGRLVERKGFDRVIEALPQLLERFPSLRYEIVGEGPQRPDLEAQVRRLGLGERVTLHGALSDDDTRAAYARAWCFALPARRVGSDVEGFGIVYLEAAMARLPAIGGRDSGAADAIVEGVTGLLVDGASVDSVRDAIVALLSDPARSEAMGQRGFERASTFTWQRTDEEIRRALGQGTPSCAPG
jgi:phosphatidylinositol alpha-1,6-mannosyltransferase